MSVVRHPWKIALFRCLLLSIGGVLLIAALANGPASATHRSLFSTVIGILTGRERQARAEMLAFEAQRSFTSARALQEARVAESAPWPMFGGTPARNMVNATDKNIA